MVETAEPKAVCTIRLEAAITGKCTCVFLCMVGDIFFCLPFYTIVHMTCNSQFQLYITLYIVNLSNALRSRVYNNKQQGNREAELHFTGPGPIQQPKKVSTR